MPRFYFDVRQDDDLDADEEGVELSDVATAQREAVMGAIDLTKELLNEAQANLVVEVRDEDGQHVALAHVSLDVKLP